MSSGIVFHSAAAITYALLAALLWLRLARSETVERCRVSQSGLLLALMLHGIGLWLGMMPAGNLFVGWSLALSAAVWLGLLVFWVESLLVRLDNLQLLLLPAAMITTTLAACSPVGHIVAHGDSPLLRSHLLVALAAYGLMTVAALQVLLMALLDRRLHRPLENPDERTIIGRVLDVQPALLVQERLLFRVVGIGFVMLTLAVGTGAVTSRALTGQLLPMDHKTVFTLLSWLTFGVLLMGRHVRGWRGQVALRWTLTGFGFLLLAYTGTRFVLEVILQRS
jgi:ABC-type uncharacterized transport system permease subunit